MRKTAFVLSSEDAMQSSIVDHPGLRRVRTELARPGSLGRSFDNKCAHDSPNRSPAVALGRAAPTVEAGAE